MNNNILIVGLGNIGDEYIHTRHNTGFIFVDKFVKLNHLTLSQEKYCNIAQLKVHNKYIFVIQPTTYMNLSGNAVKYISDKYNISLDNILVIVDNLLLPFGSFRYRIKGSSGGHNGLKNIQLCLNSENYKRLHFGIGHDFRRGEQNDYVLSKFNNQELEQIQKASSTVNNIINHMILDEPLRGNMISKELSIYKENYSNLLSNI